MSGENAIAIASQGSHGTLGSGAFEDAGIFVEIDQVQAIEGVKRELDISQPFSLTVRSVLFDFKGFLVRLSATDNDGNELDVSGSLVDVSANKEAAYAQLLPSDGELDGPASSCAANVAGMCHTNNDLKEITEATFVGYPSAANLKLEITIVQNNQG
eukprot:7508072-Ditylum_brightwellii.AAC.1